MAAIYVNDRNWHIAVILAQQPESHHRPNCCLSVMVFNQHAVSTDCATRPFSTTTIRFLRNQKDHDSDLRIQTDLFLKYWLSLDNQRLAY